ncbi:general secretion pathway protein M [Acinetobacter calcoaceticus]|uniref:General secretion pathway protein M n=1 Tax=Acinetobacter calcoaceticus TaxID=471 RepID=A0A4R1XF35_ACICA|nr:general secretion pathway protein M [Acinetobacter calcoaceticus]
MKILAPLQNKMDQWLDQIQVYLDRLSLRERVMVICAAVIVVVAGIGSALWYMHAAAEQQNQRVNDLKALINHMQSNVVTMKPADDLSLSTMDKIQRVATQQNLSVATQQQAEGAIQLVAQHENYAILANFLSQIAQMGVTIDQLEMLKSESQIKLTAKVH